MPVPSLLNLSIDAVVNGILNGSLLPTNIKLNAELSNEIYRRINIESENIQDPQAVHQILSILHITRADLRDKMLSKENDSLILINQKLDALILEDFYDSEAKNGVELAFNINGLMESMLNSESRKNLKTLDIGGYQDYFEGDGQWVEETFKNLPSLVNLNLYRRQLENSDLHFLGENLKNLRVLDISNTTLTSLDGIEKLKTLEVLAIGGLGFGSCEKLRAIFQLEKLRVLDLSSREEFDTTDHLAQFLDCNQTLPNLKFIDCSGTHASNSMVLKLLQTHPTIQKISLCFKEDLIIVHSDVEVLSTNSLTSCLKSLRWYIGLKNRLMTEQILKVIQRISMEEYEDQKEDDLRECLTVVCSTVDGFPKDQKLHRVMMQCVVHLCSEKRILLFSIRQRLDLLNLLYKLLDFYTYRTELDVFDEERRLIRQIWRFFHNHNLLISANFNLSKTVEYCLDSSLWAESENLNEKCITTMRDCVLLMTVEQEESFFSDLEICDKILFLLNRLYTLKKLYLYNMALTVVERMAKLSTTNFVAAGGVKTLIKHLEKYGVLKNFEILQDLSLGGKLHEEFHKEIRALVRFFLACKKRWLKSGSEKGTPKNLQFIVSILILNLRDSKSMYLQITNNHLKSMIPKINPKTILPYYLAEDMISLLTTTSFDARLLWGLQLIEEVDDHLQFFEESEDLKLRLMSLEAVEDSEIREKAKMLREKIYGDI